MRYLIIVFCLLSFTSYSQVNLRVKGVMPLPSQTGNSGRYLTTNGSAASWGNITLISDTSRIVTIDKTQTITGIKTFNAALGIGGSANASAAFDVTSTTQGTRPFPTMTTAQRNAISSPATGLLIFNSTDSVQQYYNGATWVDLSDYRLSRRISNKVEVVEEFLNASTSSFFSSTVSGSGANFDISASSLASNAKDSVTTGAAYLRSGNAASTALGATMANNDGGWFKNFRATNPLIFEFRLKADTCNATDTLNYVFGLGSTGAGNASLGSRFCGFIYDPRNTFGQGTSASRNIWFITRSSNNSTTTNTNIVFTPNTYQKLKIVVSATYALAYINDVLVATHTNNIPNSSDNSSAGFQFYFRTTKTVTSSNTVMGAYIDYWTFEHYLDTKR